MSALNITIDNRTGSSVATPAKLMAYVMHVLGLAPSYKYNAYLRIPISIKLFLSSACGCS